MKHLTITEFTRRANIQVPYMEANNNRFLLETNLLTGLVADLVTLNEVNVKIENPNTRTPALVHERQNLIESFGKNITKAVRSIENNSSVELSNEDEENLFIKERKTPSRIPKPSITPKVDVIERKVGSLTIQLSDPASPDLNHRRLPDGVQFINIFTAITVAGAEAPAAEDYRLFVTETKSNIELDFENKDEKKVVYIKAQFGNSNGEGRISDAIDVVIPN